jgi:fumarate reductase subunit D
MLRPSRRHAGFAAFVVHRISGIALALFLPLHFLALGQAIEGEQKLEAFLRWTDHPLLKLSEWLLAIALAAHLAGGLRLLVLEFLPWRDIHRMLIAAGAGFAILIGLVFGLSLVS